MNFNTIVEPQGSILIVRDDLYPRFFGGNKARKMVEIEKDIKLKKCNAIVTTGGIQSNHCRVTALLCAKNTWKCKLIIHGNKDDFYRQKGNALLMRLAGADIKFVEPEFIGTAMNNAVDDLRNEGFLPYYLYGGGHNKAGVESYISAVKKLYKELGEENKPDHIFLASGTGSTQAGILLGLDEIGRGTEKVHGISIARKKVRGTEGVFEAIQFKKRGFDKSKILFYDDFLFGGYGKYTIELQDFVTNVAKKSGIILDTTYTGKSYFGMMQLIKRYNLKGNFLFWHTGGLINVMA